jgi:ribosome biogenesis GTPase A
LSTTGYVQVDIVFEVRDARIINTTKHPLLDEWTHNKSVFLIINRTDMVSKKDLAAWEAHFQGIKQRVFFTNGQRGQGIERVTAAADAMSEQINCSRIRRGLMPRPVRACVMGFPNIGKSAIINRLLKRRVVESAATPGVTRSLRWIRMGERLDLLDAPGIMPMSMGMILLPRFTVS